MQILIASIGAMWILAPSGAARAEETKAPVESKHSWNLSGYVDTYFAYNPNRPFDGANFISNTGTTAKRANEFSINQAVVTLSRPPESLGFDLSFGFGSGFEVLHAAEATGPGIGPQIWRHLLTAFVSYRVPIGKGLIVQAGLFPSHIGFESFVSISNWTYSRSWMAEFSPYYQMGLCGKYAFSDSLSVQLHLLNGWQRAGENNEGKAVGPQVVWNGKKVTATFNAFAGPENANNGGSWRLFADFIVVVKPTDRLTLVAAADFGRQGRPNQSAALWYATGADVRYLLKPKLAAVVRVEGYRDETGIITGFAQTLTSVTGTLEFKPMDQLIIKVEARADHSTAPVFSARKTIDGTSVPQFVPNEALGLFSAAATF